MQLTTSDNSNSSVDDSSSRNNINLAEILTVLTDNKWLIICATVFALAIGIIITYIQKPIYKTDAMLQVEAYSQSQNTLEQIAPFLKTDIPVMAEIELINSRYVLSEAIKNLHLDIIAKPKHFPVIGEAIARRYDPKSGEDKVSPPLFGQSKYAWGGESIIVDTFRVPTGLMDETFRLIADKNDHFHLTYKDALILEGEVGKLAIKQMEGSEEFIAILVSELNARPETQFNVMRLSETTAIDQLKKSFSAGEKAKLTKILELTIEAEKPDSAVQILNEIINIYVQQNIEQKSAEVQKTLEFLEKQMPDLKNQLDTSTEALNTYQTERGTIDLNIETQGLLEGVVKIETEVTLLLQKRDELRQKFTDSHPSVQAVDKQLARLNAQVNAHDNRISSLPKTQQEILRLSRDVKVNTELYTAVLNKAQALRVSKAGTVGDIRVIDYAGLPNTPIRPKKAFIVVFSVILGLFSSIAIAFIRKALHRGIVDPDFIENKLQIPVYASIPHSIEQANLSKKLKRNAKEKNNKTFILAAQNKDDVAIESLRSLRTTLHFVCMEARNNIVMVTGPSPGVGKTFVSVNLAALLADAGKKILLIDGDLRKGYINEIFGVRKENGLSEIISSPIPDWMSLLEKTIHKIPSVNLDFIASGANPTNPSELLLHERFCKLLENISKNYDHIIIDSPPILAVTDASIIGRLASTTLMVVKAGQHPIRELEHSTKRLSLAGVQVKGIVFNNLPEVASQRAYGYSNYINKYSAKT